jgi:hypothetical protein
MVQSKREVNLLFCSNAWKCDQVHSYGSSIFAAMNNWGVEVHALRYLTMS